MKRKYSFLWIDDDSTRKKDLDTLKRRLNVDGEFKNVSGQNIATEVDGILSKPKFKFDLILIDHYLESAAGASIKTGSTVAEYIRERRPDCPIVGITAAEKATDIDLHKKSIYEDLFKVTSISEHYNSIISIAKSYRTLIKKRPGKNEDLIRLLKASKDDRERLMSIIPEDIKRDYKDKSLLINISKWVRHVLMSKPGFLYNKLWIATLLGLKEESFNKATHFFENAKYTGLFSDEGNERWWQTQVRQIIYEKYPDDQSAFPWLLGHKLPKIGKKDYSVCHVCEKEFPETVGYTDEAAKTPVPMHLRCSFIHPDFESTLYYDDIRIMEPAR
jgi:CheY-like chemotaxis protein